MNKQGKIIVVFGATGQQGGATARHLLKSGWRVRAVTRDPNKPAAQALAEAGAEVVTADMEDRAALDAVIQGAYGVFSVQNFWLPEVGVEGEIRQGTNVADAAKAANVQHFVFTSVGGAERDSGIPHFESKWAIEQHIGEVGLPATILRPAAFMENFTGFGGPRDGVLTSMTRPETPLQLIATDDIGALAALAFEYPGEYIGKAIEIAGDSLTTPQVVELMSRVSGETITFREMSSDELRQFGEDGVKMMEWFENEGYKADIPALRRLYPTLHTFEAFLREINWTPAAVPQGRVVVKN
jgi:uncharacterized protein YbjT (DUF2867 family)